jgi:ubiquinone/menaquinone biosynthesis C-methylase UbiE
MGTISVSTTIAKDAQQQKVSGDFYRQYFWKDDDVRDAGFLRFIVDNIGHERLVAASTLLDIGSGSGKFSILLKRTYPHFRIEALDISPDNINTIEENVRKAGTEITTKEGSALDSPYDEGIFDIVLCIYRLQRTPDPHLGFLEAARVTAPSGCALYSIGRKNELGIIHQKTRGLLGSVPPSPRRSTVLPFVPLYWSLLKTTGKRKASEVDLTIDLVDWLYNPLQKFVPEEKIPAWFEEAGLTYTSVGFTGLLRSMLICRGIKQGAQL